MDARIVAERLSVAGFRILSIEEGDDAVDGEVKVHSRVSIQVPTHGDELTVDREEGDGDDWCMHHGDLRTDFRLLCGDIRRAIAKADAN